MVKLMLVLKRVRLGPHRHAGLTKHTIADSKGKRDFPPFVELVIAAYPGEASCYLFRASADGQVADTWHQTIEKAFAQAEWEFGLQPEEWIAPDEPEAF